MLQGSRSSSSGSRRSSNVVSRSKSVQWILLVALLIDAVVWQCYGSSSDASNQLKCQTCVYYAKNSALSSNNPLCVTGEGIGSETCASGHACKVTFLQDSSGTIVHAARSCKQPTMRTSLAVEAEAASVVFNARTTKYCNISGCNNDWSEEPATFTARQDGGQQRLHCWVGHGRRIDDFQLKPCSDRVVQLAAAASARAAGQLTPVCLLAQLTRQIAYNNRAYESTMYLADCVPHASFLYGRNYPMFEYERVCRSAGCNAGAAAPKLQYGIQQPSLSTAGFVAGSGEAAVAKSPTATAAVCATALVGWAMLRLRPLTMLS